MGSGVAMAGNTHARSALHAGGNPDVDGFSPAHTAFTAADAAQSANPARTSTARACDIKTHAAADLRNMSRASADFTRLGRAHGA